MSKRLQILTLCALASLALLGCKVPGLPDEEAKLAQREADGKAIGSACRHALRGIEDCYALNPKASKSAVFSGWKDMDQYMRDNKIEGMASTQSPARAETPAEGGHNEAPPVDQLPRPKNAKSGSKAHAS